MGYRLLLPQVVDWGYYYLVTEMDDFSRYILAWEVQRDMTADSLIKVVQEPIMLRSTPSG